MRGIQSNNSIGIFIRVSNSKPATSKRASQLLYSPRCLHSKAAPISRSTTSKSIDKSRSNNSERKASTSTHHQPPDAIHPPPFTSPSQSSNPTFTSTLSVPDSDVEIHLNPSKSFIGISSPSNGIPHHHPYHIDHFWLRDACMSTGENDGNQVPSIHKSTSQKLFHTGDIASVHLDRGESLLDWSNPPKISLSPNNTPALTLQFSTSYPVLNSFSSLFSTQLYKPTQPHITTLPIDFLLMHSSSKLYKDYHSDVFGIPIPWKVEDMKMPNEQTERYDRPIRLEWRKELGGTSDQEDLNLNGKIKTNDGLNPNDEKELEILKNRFEITKGLLRDGLVFVKGLDNVRNGSEMGKDGIGKVARLKDLAEIVNILWISMECPIHFTIQNIAYTNLDLGLHMDLCYFQSPPRFQFLHVLKSKVSGGESIFVDSFSIAKKMWKEERELWEILTEIKVGFWYQNDGRFYRFNHQTFEIDPDYHQDSSANEEILEDEMPRLRAVNYSPPFQSPLPLIASSNGSQLNEEKRQLFFKAFKRFTELSHEKEFRYERKLDEKECVIFDNRRVLHARRGFEWNENEQETNQEDGEGEVRRWLKGCYVDGDAIWSSHRILRSKLRSLK